MPCTGDKGQSVVYAEIFRVGFSLCVLFIYVAVLRRDVCASQSILRIIEMRYHLHHFYRFKNGSRARHHLRASAINAFAR